MSARRRKAIGLTVLLLGLLVYALAAMQLAQALPASWAVQIIYYPVVGLAWFYPAARLIRWMQALDR